MLASPLALSSEQALRLQTSFDLEKFTGELRLRFLRIAQALRQEDRALAVSAPQRAVLRWLVLEPLRISDLARAEGVSMPAMTQMAQRLIECGWIERQAPTGTYNNRLRITQEGREIVAQAAKIQNANLACRLESLSGADLRALEGLLPLLDQLFAREPWREPNA